MLDLTGTCTGVCNEAHMLLPAYRLRGIILKIVCRSQLIFPLRWDVVARWVYVSVCVCAIWGKRVLGGMGWDGKGVD